MVLAIILCGVLGIALLSVIIATIATAKISRSIHGSVLFGGKLVDDEVDDCDIIPYLKPTDSLIKFAPNIL